MTGTRSRATRRRSPCRSLRSAAGRRAPARPRDSARVATGGRCRRCGGHPRVALGRARACRRCTSSPPCRCARRCRARRRRPRPLREGPTEPEIELQAERGQLHRDIRLELVALDRLERAVIRVRDRLRLCRLGHLLAENVDGRELSLCVQARACMPRVLERRAGDVTAGELLDDPPWDRGKEIDHRPVEDLQRGPILGRSTGA